MRWHALKSEQNNIRFWVDIKGGLPGCALNNEHELICWRSSWPEFTNEGGSLYFSYGGNDIEHIEILKAVDGVRSFDIEGSLVCVVSLSGGVVCRNVNVEKVWNVYEVDGVNRKEYINLFIGMGRVCALTERFEVTCWDFQYSPDGFYYSDLVEVDLCLNLDVRDSFAIGVKCACKANDKGTVRCCGDFCNQSPLEEQGDFKLLSMGMEHVCALDLSGSIVCARMGTHFGDSWEDYQCMLNVPDGEFTKVDVGEFHACGLRNDRSVVCWGGVKDKNGSCDMPVDNMPGEHVCKDYVQEIGQLDRERALCNIFSDGQVHQGKYSSFSVSDRQMCLLKESGAVRCRGDWNFEFRLD